MKRKVKLNLLLGILLTLLTSINYARVLVDVNSSNMNVYSENELIEDLNYVNGLIDRAVIWSILNLEFHLHTFNMGDLPEIRIHVGEIPNENHNNYTFVIPRNNYDIVNEIDQSKYEHTLLTIAVYNRILMVFNLEAEPFTTLRVLTSKCRIAYGSFYMKDITPETEHILRKTSRTIANANDYKCTDKNKPKPPQLPTIVTTTTTKPIHQPPIIVHSTTTTRQPPIISTTLSPKDVPNIGTLCVLITIPNESDETTYDSTNHISYLNAKLLLDFIQLLSE